MKRLTIFFAVCFFAFFQIRAAAEFDYSIKDYPEFYEYASSIASGENKITPESMLSALYDAVFGEISRSKALLAQIMAIAAAAGILKLLGNDDTTQTAYFASYALMSALTVRLVFEAAGYGSETIHTLCDFVSKLAPVLLGLLAAGGAVTSAAAFSPVLSAAVFLFSEAVDKIITPLVYMSAVLGIVGNMSEKVQLGSFNKLIRSVTRWLLTAFLTIFTSLCALYGFNAPVLDALGAKTAKFAVGTLVPVVGGLLADTMETVVGGTRILKNAVGSAGMICVVLLAAAPVVKVWVIMFMMKLCAALAEPLCDRKMSMMLSDAAESAGTVFSVMITAVMLFIISIGIILGSTGIG